MGMSIGLSVDVTGGPVAPLSKPVISFVNTAPANDGAMTLTGLGLVGGELAIFQQARTLNTGFPTIPDPNPLGLTEIVATRIMTSLNTYIVNWWCYVPDGGVITDPFGTATGIHRALFYRNAKIKAGSVVETPFNPAVTTAPFPAVACDPLLGEWAVQLAYMRTSQTLAQMDSCLAPTMTDQSAGTGKRRYVRNGSANSAIGGDTGGVTSGAGAYSAVGLSSTQGQGLTFILEPR